MEQQNNIQNPWKGLQSYQETDIIYGRDEEIKALYTKILYNTQTVVYGKSGIGKSSIINAGIIPRAKLDDMLPISIRLAHTTSKDDKPSLPYVEQIKQRIIEELKNQGGEEPEEVVTHNPEHQETLWELLHRHRFWLGQGESKKQITPLLLFDQFEEIFTLETDSKRVSTFFAELADLLNEIMPDYLSSSHHTNELETPNELVIGQERQKNVFNRIAKKEVSDHPQYIEKSNFHIVFILREDFLSYLERSTAYIPVMKTNRYALLPLNEEQAADIIMLPQKGLVSKSVAELIIQKVAGRTDFKLDGIPEIEVDAAILSLYLSRLYYKKRNDESEITKELVTQFSDDIIKDFYEESVSGIPNDIIEKIEDQLLTYDNRRNNVSRKDLVQIGIPDTVLTTLVDEKKLLRQFNYRGDNRIEFVHDTLCKVVENRIEQRQITAQKKKQEKELQLLRERNKRYAFSIVALLVLLSLFGFILWDGLYHDIESHYGIVVKKNGWFEGLEKLSESEASYRDCHFVLKKHGRWAKHPYAMEARDGYGKLTANHNMGAYILNQYDDTDKGADQKMVEKLKTVCQWEFVCNQGSDFVVQERALDEKGNLVFTYDRSQTKDPYKVISSYSDDYGFPLILRDSTYFYIQTSYDERGFEILMEFFDDQGMPITNKDSVYQTRKFYLDNGVESAEFSCFLDGRRTMDRFGNCGWIRKFSADSLRSIESTFVDADLNYCRSTEDSVIVIRYEYDEHGRLTKISYWDENGRPDTCSQGYHIRKIGYNRHGELTNEIYFGIDSLRCFNNTTIDGVQRKLFEWTADYDEWGNMIFINMACDSILIGVNKEFTKDGNLVKNVVYQVYNIDRSSLSGDTIYKYMYYKDLQNRTELERDADERCSIRTSFDEYNNPISVACFDFENETPIDSIWGYHINKMKYTYNYNGNTTCISDCCYNLDNEIVYHHEIRVDSVNHTKSELRYNRDGSFMNGYRITFDDKFTVMKTQESIDENWENIRTYKNNQFYYCVKPVYPIKPSRSNEKIGWYAFNEIGVPSVIYDNEKAYHANYFAHGEDLYFDEYGKRINPYEHEWNYLAYIELTQSDTAIGFKNADIVIACNDWDMWFYSNDPMESFNNTTWWDEIDRNFIVARVNESKDSYDTIHVFVPASIINIEKYVEFKKCRCTSQEARRINAITKQFIRKKMVLAEPSDKHHFAYRSGIRETIIILDYNGWNFIENGIDNFSDSLEWNRNKHKRIVYLDIETESIKSFETDADAVGLHCWDDYIRPSGYSYIVELYNEWKNKQQP